MTKELLAEEVLLKECCYYYWKLRLRPRRQLQLLRLDLAGLHLWIEAGYCCSTTPTFGHVNGAALCPNLHGGHCYC